MNATIGVLAALQYREKTGRGQFVDVSLFDAQVSALLNTASAWLNSGVVLGRTGNDHPSAAPYGVYEASDGHIIIATFNDREFQRLADALGHPEWKVDPTYATNGGRVANRAAIKAEISAIIALQPRHFWVDKLNAATVSCGPINDMKDLEKDPQVMAREMIVRMGHPQFGEVRMAASPHRLSASPVEYRRSAPILGQDTEAVLQDVLGLSTAELEAARSAGAI